MARLSIGLPVFNGDEFLRESIECILGQTFGDFDLLISDNASTDSTESICREYVVQDDRVRYHRHRENLGAAFNFNWVFWRTDGEYFKWVAHDDICRPDFLAACVAGLDGNPEAVLAMAEVDLIDANGDVIGPHDEGLYAAGDSRAWKRFHNVVLEEHWCTDVFGVIRRSVLERTPLIGNHQTSDRNLLAELALHGPFVRVPGVLFSNRQHRERSVQASDIRDEERSAWFDTKAARRITLPFWRYCAECLRSVHRAPVSRMEKVACAAAVVAWMPQNRWRLKDDVVTAVNKLMGKRLP